MDKKFISNFFKGIVSTSFGTIVKVGFHFLSVMLMARYVSREALGLYFLTMVVVHFLTILSGLGLDLTLVKFISGKETSLQSESFITASIIRLLSVAVASTIFFWFGKFLLPYFDERLNVFIGQMTVLFALSSLKDWLLRLMQGMQKYRGYAIAEVISAVSRVVLLVVLQKQLSVGFMLSIEIVVLFPALFVQLYVLRSFLQKLSIKYATLDTFRNLSRFGFPLYLNNILSFFIDRGGTLLIGILLTPQSVAAYEFGLKIPEGFMKLFTSFILVYFPSQSMLFSIGDRKEAEKFMNNTLVLLSTGISVLVLIAFIFREDIIALVFSREYIEVSMAFALLMFNFYLRAISNVLGYSIVSSGNSSAPIITNFLSALVNIVSSIILIQEFGYLGAVYSLILMNITSQIVYILFLRRVKIILKLVEYLMPLLVLLIFVGIYIIMIGGNNLNLGIVIIGCHIFICWLVIKQVREFSISAMDFITRKLGFDHLS